MQQLEHEEEEPIVSEEYRHQKKVKNFKEYLVSSGCVMHLIKFLLGIRNKQRADDSVPSEDVLKMFYEYIGAVQIDTSEFDGLKQQVEQVKQENLKISQEIANIKTQIEQKKIAKQKAEEQKRLKEEEELAKNTKKGGKK